MALQVRVIEVQQNKQGMSHALEMILTGEDKNV